MNHLAEHEFSENTHFAILTSLGKPALATPRKLITLDGVPLCVCIMVSTIDGSGMYGSIVAPSALKHSVKDTTTHSKEHAATTKIASGKYGTEPCRFQQGIAMSSLVALPRDLVGEFREMAKDYIYGGISGNLTLVSEKGPL